VWANAAWRILLFLALFYGLMTLGVALFASVIGTLRGPAVFLGAAVVLAAALIAGATLIRVVDKRELGALGTAWTPRTWPDMLTGFGVGLGAIVVAAAVLVAAGALRYQLEPGDAWFWLDGQLQQAWIFLVAAFAEEVLYRGYPFQVLAQTFGGIAAALVTSIAFAFGHAQNPNVGTFGLVNIFLAGVLLSAAYLKTRSLWLPTMLHLGWNWGMASLLDLPVSGFELIDTPFYEPVVRGPEWLSGGGFGPEGGVAGSIGFAAALAALFLLKNVRVAEEMKALRPLPDG
jgi:membrane protease YdiL (CAAX protease family)